MKPNRVSVICWIDEVSKRLNEFEEKLPLPEETSVDDVYVFILLSHMRAIREKAAEFGFRGLEKLAAVGENTLDLLSIEGVSWDGEILMTLSSVVDGIRESMTELKFNGRESNFFFQHIIDMYNRINANLSYLRPKENQRIFHPIFKPSISKIFRRTSNQEQSIKRETMSMIEPLDREKKSTHQQTVSPSQTESADTVTSYSVSGYPVKRSNISAADCTYSLPHYPCEDDDQNQAMALDGTGAMLPAALGKNIAIMQQSVNCVVLAMNNFAGLMNSINQSMLESSTESKEATFHQDQIEMYCASIGRR